MLWGESSGMPCCHVVYAVMKPKSKPPGPPVMTGLSKQPVSQLQTVGETSMVQTGGTASSQGIQPRMTQSGQPLQTSKHGNCACPGCPYPKRIDSDGQVLDYCSKTCAQKADYIKQNTAFTVGGGGGYQQMQYTNPHPQGSNQSGRSPGRVAMVSVRGGGGGGILCKKCNSRQANPGRGWCQQCYVSSQTGM